MMSQFYNRDGSKRSFDDVEFACAQAVPGSNLSSQRRGHIYCAILNGTQNIRKETRLLNLVAEPVYARSAPGSDSRCKSGISNFDNTLYTVPVRLKTSPKYWSRGLSQNEGFQSWHNNFQDSRSVVNPDPNCISFRQLCGSGSVFGMRIRINTFKNRDNFFFKSHF